ncbi:MAG: enoyl-CoA hydratase/isomerase family protein [Promethearchaeota archaeon]
MSPDYANILVDVTDRVATVTVNRPPLNVLDKDTLIEIRQALGKLKEDSTVTLVVLRTAGNRFFCVGVDVEQHLPEHAPKTLKAFNDVFKALLELDKPVIAVVQGSALGGGCELAFTCDMVIAAESAKFGQPEIQVGAVPTVAAAFMHHFIGPKRTFELCLTGKNISAAEAERMGLITRAVPDGELEEAVNQLVSKLKEYSPVMLSYVRRAIYASLSADFMAALKKVTELYLESLETTEDATEGLKAFLEKRKPVWKGK